MPAIIIHCVQKATALHTNFFTSGVLALHNAGMIALDFLDSVDNHYGIDSGHLKVDNDDEILTVSPINIQLNQQQITSLQHTINPLATSENYGIEIYQQPLNCLTT